MMFPRDSYPPPGGAKKPTEWCGRIRVVEGLSLEAHMAVIIHAAMEVEVYRGVKLGNLHVSERLTRVEHCDELYVFMAEEETNGTEEPSES